MNASLNALSGALLFCGWLCIRRGKVQAHRACMGAAFVCSIVFLGCYLYYHYQVGSVRYQGTGALRALYFAVLISHTVLAALVPPLALRTLYLAVKERFDEHRWWGRRTLPVWLYVSVTGVVVYAMLYRL